MRILTVSSEAVPWAKTGGLGDAMGALPRYLGEAGHDVRLLVPWYDHLQSSGRTFDVALDHLTLDLGPHRYPARILRDRDQPWAWILWCPALFHRGRVYTSDADEHRRFLGLQVAAILLCQHTGWAPDIIQCNDWQTAMLPLLLRARFGWDRLFARTRTLLTIHNLGYQGGFPASILPDLDLGASVHLLHQEFLRGGRINFLLHGILYADAVSTVSPTYAKEIQTPEFGVGLDPFLRARSRSVFGILNGVDYTVWSPDQDPLIPHPFSADDLAGKEQNRAFLLAEAGLQPQPGAPLFGVVSRMVWQKGLELVAEVMPEFLARGAARLVVLGSGEPRIEERFQRLQQVFPRQVVFRQGYSEPLAHRIEAGADIFLMPSRYEPCGLNQLYSLRYGTVPIVHKTGGLADTVSLWSPSRRTGTGFPFAHHNAQGLRWAVQAARSVWQDRDAWQSLMRNGMREDFSWTRQAGYYLRLFEHMLRSAR
jgi:starch synthase